MHTWEFQKKEVPQDHEGKIELAKSLEEYSVSLVDYINNYSTIDM